MEKNSGYLPESTEIEPIEHEMYFALEQPLLDEILRTDRYDHPEQIFAIDYLRPTPDGELEKVGMVISDRHVSDRGVAGMSYDVTVFHFKQGAKHAIENKDSFAYVITETSGATSCQTDAMYASGAYVARHSMDAEEHMDLLNELLAAREWQLASAYEHDILSK